MLRPASTVPDEDAVVTVMRGAVGAHVGILYLDDDGARRHLELAFHHALKDSPDLPDGAFWVEPGLDAFALSDLCASAQLIARRQQDGRIPYAFHPHDAAFDSTGTLQLNKSRGLTCATLVVLVFAHAKIRLLDSTTWDQSRSDERKREDAVAQHRLVAYLRQIPAAKQHADLVEAEVGCTRIRAEEVAAASGMSGHPIPFARAEPEGRRVLEAVLNPQAPLEPQTMQTAPIGSLGS